MKRLALCIALTLVLAGQAAFASPPGPATASKAKAVVIDDFKFKPSPLVIEKGTRVTFTNSAGVAHTATDKGAFDTGRIKPGSSASVRFAQQGAFNYHCKIHPFMRGKVVVN